MFFMSPSPPSNRKRSRRVEHKSRDSDGAVSDLRTCAQCAAKVGRRECHKNRFGQYICIACIAKLRQSVQSSPGNPGVQTQPRTEAHAEESPSRPKQRSESTPRAPRRLRRSQSAVGRTDVPERLLHASVNLLVLLFLLVVIWLIWAQF